MSAFRFDNPDEYVNGTPYAELARLRREAPFAWHRTSSDPADGFWLVLKHHDVVSISKNPQLFATHAPLLADPLPRDLWPAFPALAMIADNLLAFPPPKHSIFRPLANSLFSTARLAEAEENMRAVCVEAMARVAGRSRFDFADEVALPIPVQIVLGTFLGVAREDLGRMTRCILTINAMDDPVYRPTGESLLEAAEELCAYGLALLRRLESRPDQSILSELVHHRSLEGVSREELFMAYWFPLAAGAFDTTASTMAGGVRALLQHPEQLERLRGEPSLVPQAAEELVRWVSPVVYFRRTATADTELHGHRIQAGQKLILCYASANRDEDVFAHADSFDLARSPNPHVSFGHGPHFCLGARLSSSILRVFLEEFPHRLPDLRLEGPVTHTRSAWMNRIRAMPVGWLPAAAAAPPHPAAASTGPR